MILATAMPASVLTHFEAFAPTIDALWTALRPLGKPGRRLRVGFTACSGGEGTTTVAACAAVSLALHGGQEVALVEADATSPGLARWLGLEEWPGLEEVRRGLVPLEEALRTTDVPGLRILPCGGGAAHGAEPGVLDGPRAADLWRLWERIAATGSHVLVDVPPVLVERRAIPILASTETAVLVLDGRRATKRDAARAIEAITISGCAFGGTVLNRCVQDMPAWIRRRRSARGTE